METENKAKFLEWDSRLFGYRIASLNLVNLSSDDLKLIIKELEGESVRLVYCFANPSDLVSNNSLRAMSAFLADEKVTFSCSLPSQNINESSDHIESYKLNIVTPKLRLLALQSGEFSRFRLDPRFTNNEYDKLYSVWIENSVNKYISDEILVFNENDSLYGFITLSIKNQIGSIGLIAVDQEVRGKSIGKKLVNASLKYFNEKNIGEVEVVTQSANKGACRFYESCGFKIKSIINVYHLWTI